MNALTGVAVPAGGRADVLLAVVRLHQLNGRVTIREISAATGLRSTSTIHAHLERLRADGFVTWTEGEQGTLRPTVTEVPVGPAE